MRAKYVKNFRDWSLFSKIYLLVCLLLVLTVAFSNLLDELLSDSILRSEVRRRSLEAARNVARDLATAGSMSDPVRLNLNFLSFLEINPSISRLDAYERQGDDFRVAGTTSKTGPPMLSTVEKQSLLQGRPLQQDQVIGGELCLLTLHPVEVGGHVAGAVALLISQRELAFLRATHRRVGFWLTPFSALLLVLVTYFVLQRGLRRRLRNIIATMRQVKEGRLDVRIPEDGSDELGVISARFNEMIASVQAAAAESAQLHVQVDRFNQELQKRVERASAELEQKYRELQQANEELMSVQMRLSRAERLAVAGQVAATFAHEVGSPLSAISTHLQLLQEEPGLSEEARGRVDIIYQQIERVVDIVQQLLATSRPQEVRYAPLNVTHCLAEILSLSRQNLAKRHIAVKDETASQLPLIRGNPQQLQQVFLNLINNAADAMRGGGTLTIQSSVLSSARPPAVELRFIDTGPGIPAAQLGKIFQPFFSTKDSGKGSGLGLAIASEIVRWHGGQIEAHSPEGSGATFVVRLPYIEA